MRTPKLGRRAQSCDVAKSYNIVVLGDSRVGKTSIIKKLLTGTYPTDYEPTTSDVYVHTLQDEDGKMLAHLQLFDTGGVYEFPAMLKLTITKCEACFVVYSTESKRSLELAKQQFEEIERIKGKHCPCLLVGNKSDLQRTVSYEMGVKTAVQHGCSYIETSALKDENINEAFCSMLKKIEYTNSVKKRLLDDQQPLKRSSSLTSFFKNSFASSD